MSRLIRALAPIVAFGLLGRGMAVETPNVKPAERWWNKARQECVALVLQSGTDLNHRDQDGDTPLMAATRLDWYAVVHALLEAGADYRLRNNRGGDVLCDIVESAADPGGEISEWREKVIDWLVDQGVDFRDAQYWAQHRENGQIVFGRWCNEQDNRANCWLEIKPRTARDHRLRGAGHRWMHAERAWAWSIKNDQDKVIADYDALLAIDPRDARAYDG